MERWGFRLCILLDASQRSSMMRQLKWICLCGVLGLSVATFPWITWSEAGVTASSLLEGKSRSTSEEPGGIFSLRGPRDEVFNIPAQVGISLNLALALTGYRTGTVVREWALSRYPGGAWFQQTLAVERCVPLGCAEHVTSLALLRKLVA